MKRSAENHTTEGAEGKKKDEKWREDGEDEMVRIKVEKGYMTTPSVDEEK